jgi:hypothetical protein
MNLTRININLSMQPRGLSKANTYLSQSVSKNTRRRTQGLTKGLPRGFVCQSLESSTRDPNVSIEEA